MKRGNSLSPTLWRTCRALANRRRLLVFQSLLQSPRLTVTAVAESNNISVVSASQCLRTLNARGLLRVSRDCRWVKYCVGHDPSVPATESLVAALSRQLWGGNKEAVDRTFKDVTAFTHLRRISIIRSLVRYKSMSVQQLRAATGISVPALHRHLAKLISRGIVRESDRVYSYVRPKSPVLRLLMAQISVGASSHT